MKKIIEILRQDEEINQIKKQWLEIGTRTWMPFNFDEYSTIDEYKQKLRIELKKMKEEQALTKM